jgi:[ribosomal protein S5]-alanine N-acetyltransferase
MNDLVTERLVIRNFRPDDWRELQELAIAYQASPSAQYEDPWPTSEEGVKGMAGWFASGDAYLAVCLKATGTLIGMIAIDRREGQQGRVHNLGYVFHPGTWGRGYATEGCRAAMGHLFGPLAADGILTGTRPENERSVRLLVRLGLAEVARGEYALSRADWLASGRDGAARDGKSEA